jgi:DNA-binding transcriptional LysR family regulator
MLFLDQVISFHYALPEPLPRPEKRMGHASLSTNLRSLECLRAVIVTGSATGAARQLGLTQPAVSRLLGVLERSIGFQLFERRKGRLVPTEEARTLCQEVDIALQSIDRVAQLARNLRNADFGELSIVSPPSFAEGVLSEVISRFMAAHPGVRVSLDSQSVEVAREMVALRAVDCGFVKLPADYPGLQCEPLVRAGTLCALPAGHRLAACRRVTVADLDGEPLILLGKGRASREQIDDAFRDAGVRMNVKVETHTVSAACAFARGGTGIAIVNEMLGVRYAGPGLALRRFAPDFVHEYAFMTSAGAPMTRVTGSFLEHCRAFFAKSRRRFTLAGASRVAA